MYRLTAFEVTHALDYFTTYAAPFDIYSLTIFAFAIEKATNRPIPIITFAAGQAPSGFIISSTEEVTMNNYTYDSGTGPTMIEVQSRAAYIELRRSQFVLAFTICLLFINWALTVGSIYITLVVAFKKEGKNDTVLLLPVTIMLTIPTLRSLYGGSPPFGIFIGKSWALRPQFEY